MNISFNSYNNNVVSLFRESVLSSLTAQQKKILVVVSIAFGLLATISAYAIKRYCFKPLDFVDGDRPLTGEKILDLAKKKNFSLYVLVQIQKELPGNLTDIVERITLHGNRNPYINDNSLLEEVTQFFADLNIPCGVLE